MANKARRLLIQIGKTLPFALCFIILLSYTESVIALATENYVEYGETIILNKPISFAIAEYFEYDLLTVAVILIISVAIEVCKWNLLATLYAAIQLTERSFFDFELEPFMIYAICIANIIVCVFFVYKGVKILLK